MPASNEWKQILREIETELSAVEGNLVSAASGAEVHTVFVTSCRSGEGRTTASACLAHALATHARARVVLVDGSLSAPRVHEVFGLDPAPGLSDVLLSRARLDDALRATEYRNLTVLPAGAAAEELANDLDPQGLQAVLQDLRGRFQYVVFDGHSVQTSSEACVLGKLFDGVVFAVECAKTKWEVLDLGKDKITRAGGTVLGVILNRRRYYVPRFLYGRL